MLVPVIAAAGAVVVAVIGYFATSRNDRRRREAEARLKYTERQLEELYGPLAFLVIEGRHLSERTKAWGWTPKQLKKVRGQAMQLLIEDPELEVRLQPTVEEIRRATARPARRAL